MILLLSVKTEKQLFLILQNNNTIQFINTQHYHTYIKGCEDNCNQPTFSLSLYYMVSKSSS